MTRTAVIVRGCLQGCGLPMGSERLLDPLIAAADRALRAIAAPAHASRPYPGVPQASPGQSATPLPDQAQRRQSVAKKRSSREADKITKTSAQSGSRTQ